MSKFPQYPEYTRTKPSDSDDLPRMGLGALFMNTFIPIFVIAVVILAVIYMPK